MTTEPGAPTSLLPELARGHRSALVSQAIRVACKAVSVVVLARLVAPAEHGLYAMAAGAFFVLATFRDAGLGAAALQAKSLSEEQLTTLFHAHVVLGTALTAATWLLAPAAAAFYGDPRITPLLATIGIAFALLGANAWPRVLLSRQLRFPELNRLEAVAAILATGAMIAAGSLGAGAYAFATFLLTSEAIILLLAWRACRWRPRARARWHSLRTCWGTAGNVTGYQLLLTVLQQVDVALMGRWFGPAATGWYARPAQLLMLPAQHVAAPLAQVLLPTLTRTGTASREFAHHVRATANLTAHLTLPFAVVCAVLPHETVRLLLGGTWLEAVPLLRWLALGAVASYLSSTVYAVCVAAGNARRLAAITALTLATTVVALAWGRRHGPEGIAAAVALVNCTLLPVRLWWAARGTPLRVQDFITAFAGPVLLAMALGIGMLGARALVDDADWGVRLTAGLTGGALAAGLLLATWPRLHSEWRQALHRPAPPRPPPPPP